MNIMVPIPDDLAARFGSEAELGRRALEALALEEYRAGRLTRPELGRLIGLETGPALDGFLTAHGVDARERQHEDAQQTGMEKAGNERAEADALVEQFRAFRAGKTRGGLDIQELIAEGRR
jgi:hypothetical protein